MNFFIIIGIIIILFLLSGDKNLVNTIISNKLLVLVVLIYFVYNNINFVFLLLIFAAVLLYNENVRNFLTKKYGSYISNIKGTINNFLDNNEIDPNDVKEAEDDMDKLIEETEIPDIKFNLSEGLPGTRLSPDSIEINNTQ